MCAIRNSLRNIHVDIKDTIEGHTLFFTDETPRQMAENNSSAEELPGNDLYSESLICGMHAN